MDSHGIGTRFTLTEAARFWLVLYPWRFDTSIIAIVQQFILDTASACVSGLRMK